MILLLASFDEFTLFLKIVMWIAVPLIIVSFVVTTLFHYRQKKKNALKGDETPELPSNQVVDISLVSRLQKEVVHYKKRIKELQHALHFAKEVIPPETLQARVSSLQTEVSALDINAVPEAAVAGDPGLGDGHLFGGTSAVTPASESESGISTHGALASGVDFPASAAYLQDLVNEQKTHVLFLQQQLEARIRSFHELEFQFRENSANLEKMTISYEHLRHQLDDSDAAASMLRIEKDSMQEKINRLEKSLRELQEQHNKSLKILDQKSSELAEKAEDPLNINQMESFSIEPEPVK